MPYHMIRNTMHLFLSNYMVIPLIIMISLWILEEKMVLTKKNNKGQICFSPNKFCILALLFCLIISSTGIYYAFYACFTFAFAFFLFYLRKGSLLNQNFLVTASLGYFIFIILLLLHLSSFIYWAQNGLNKTMVFRDINEVYSFSLKIIYLFLPVDNHYIPYFSHYIKRFDNSILESEAYSESLGIIGASGLLFSLLWLLCKNFSEKKDNILEKTISRFNLNAKDQEFISNLSSLNLLILLFASVGGLMMIIALPVPQLRSHARFAIFIAFISLFIIAIITDKLIAKSKNRVLSKSFFLLIFLLGLFDQVGKISPQYLQKEEEKIKIKAERNFVKQIENSLPQGSIIFQLS